MFSFQFAHCKRLPEVNRLVFIGQITGHPHDLHGKIWLVSGESIFPSTNPLKRVLPTDPSHPPQTSPGRRLELLLRLVFGDRV